MKCPKCKDEHAKYVEQRNVKVHKKEKPNRLRQRRIKGLTSGSQNKKAIRDNFEATHKCGWKGVM